LDRARDEIRAAGGDVVVVYQYRAQPARNFCRQRGVELERFADPARKAYAEVGLERGSALDFATRKVAIRFVRAVREGGAPGKPEPTAHKPGTFVVGPDGRVALAHYNPDPSDNPEIEDVLAAVRASAAA
jgi:peroxiredoxin